MVLERIVLIYTFLDSYVYYKGYSSVTSTHFYVCVYLYPVLLRKGFKVAGFRWLGEAKIEHRKEDVSQTEDKKVFQGLNGYHLNPFCQ